LFTVGWVLLHDRNGLFKEVRQGLADLTTIVLGANSIVQSAVAAILTPKAGSDAEKSIKAFSERYLGILCDNAKFTTERLGAIDGLNVVVPNGAMYVMVGIDMTKLTGVESDVDFANKLLNEG
jgi:tyrosine aminotransferase